jgi:hypothetical protein
VSVLYRHQHTSAGSRRVLVILMLSRFEHAPMGPCFSEASRIGISSAACIIGRHSWMLAIGIALVPAL